MKQNNDTLLLEMLKTEWELLDASIETLLHSVEKCRKIGIKPGVFF